MKGPRVSSIKLNIRDEEKFAEVETAIGLGNTTVNMLDPFREGNGVPIEFPFPSGLQHIGLQLDLTAVDPDEFIFATIQAARGVVDQLADCFEQTIRTLQP